MIISILCAGINAALSVLNYKMEKYKVAMFYAFAAGVCLGVSMMRL